MSRNANWVLLLSRYAFGFRIIIPAACGALDMPTLRFSIINLIAGTIWAVPMALLGFYLGHGSSGTPLYQIWAFGILLTVGASILVLRHLRQTEWVEDLKTVDLHTLVPLLIGLMGAINLTSAILPRSQASILRIASWLCPWR